VTDIAGFGLLGHGYEMAEKSDVCLRFIMGMLPFVAGAKAYAEQWLFPAGSCNNQRFYEEHISFGDNVPEETRMLLFTPETSGGLLAAIPPQALPKLSELCAARPVTYWVIGQVRWERALRS
jgi:selenide,water dikinase